MKSRRQHGIFDDMIHVIDLLRPTVKRGNKVDRPPAFGDARGLFFVRGAMSREEGKKFSKEERE